MTSETIRVGITTYLREQHPGDVSWHPLYQAGLELYSYLLSVGR